MSNDDKELAEKARSASARILLIDDDPKLCRLVTDYLVFFNLQFRFAPDSLLSAASGNRMGSVARSIADEMRAAAPGERSAILRRYSSSYRVEFLLYANLVQEICAREAGCCRVKIEVAEHLCVLAHSELLSRALANVLRNAARYAGDSVLRITARQKDDRIRLSIADQGPGVPPETLTRLFDPFYRLEPDRARATGGSGLGLAIVKTCVEACQGTVAAHNLHPSGLEISIVLQAASN